MFNMISDKPINSLDFWQEVVRSGKDRFKLETVVDGCNFIFSGKITVDNDHIKVDNIIIHCDDEYSGFLLFSEIEQSAIIDLYSGNIIKNCKLLDQDDAQFGIYDTKWFNWFGAVMFWFFNDYPNNLDIHPILYNREFF